MCYCIIGDPQCMGFVKAHTCPSIVKKNPVCMSRHYALSEISIAVERDIVQAIDDERKHPSPEHQKQAQCAISDFA